MPNFAEYDRRESWGKRHRQGEVVTITRTGLLSFSPAAIEALGNPAAIKYLVDTDERLLGFRAAKLGAKNAMRTRQSGKGATRVVSATAVLRHMGIDYCSEALRYPITVLDGVHCIDLKQPGEIVTSNRARTS